MITTHNRKKKAMRLINSLLCSTNYEDLLEIIVIDDASTDGTFNYLQKKFHHKIRIIKNEEEKLISQSRNLGLKEAKGKYVFFIDDDVVLSQETLTELTSFLVQNNNVACVIPIILYYDKPDIVWCSGIKHNFWTTLGQFLSKNKKYRGQLADVTHTDSVITAFMVRKSIARESGFDSLNFPIGWEDIDFSTRIIRKGYDLFVVPQAKVWHDFTPARFIHNNFRLYYEVRNRILFHRRWSTSFLQRAISVTFSITIGITYLILNLILSNNFVSKFKTVFKAIKDGLLHQL